MAFLFFPGLSQSQGTTIQKIEELQFFQVITFIVLFTVIIALSFYTRHPLSGVLISIFISIAFLCGHVISIATRILLFSQLWDTPEQYAANQWVKIFAFGPGTGGLVGMLSAVLGLTSLGLLAGLIGYVFTNISPLPSESYPHVFRDYWSQVKGFKKSSAQEYPDWDRKLAGWSVFKGSWIQHITKKLREPRQELIFLPNSSGSGDLYDVSSNKTIRDLVDYNKLISNYIPKLIHDPIDIVNMLPIGKRIRTPPAFRELIGKITNDLVNSSYTLLVFFILMLSVALGPAMYSYAAGRDSGVVILTFIATSIPSIMTFALTLGFKKKSEELIEKRPDESAFVLSVFLCLFLIYPIILWILVNQPDTIFYHIPYSWVAEWFWGWTVPFLTLSAILGFGYIFIHRETENINVYFFDSRTENVDSGLAPFSNPDEKPSWLDEEYPDPADSKKKVKTDFFWVIRFMYYWRGEFTLPLPHLDWERIELWIDAKKGVLKWVVSDYHYREVWYKIENPYVKKLPDVFVYIWPNFHTPVPIVDYGEATIYSDALKASKKELVKTILKGLQLTLSRDYRKHKNDALVSEEKRSEDIDAIVKEQGENYVTKVLEKIKCNKIRYIKGVEYESSKGGLFYKTELAYVDSTENSQL
jgi:hypothetical protein